MGKITFVLGGARSGKSGYAVQLAQESGKKVAFIATCPYFDEEMEERIRKHKEERPPEWGCFEEFKDIAPLIKRLDQEYDYGFVLIDCLTLFTSNLVLDEFDEEEIKKRTQNMLDELKKASFDAVLVANEVGLGIIPEYPVSRKFRDYAGRVNQLVAKSADEVFFTVAGIPTKIKT
ncbi:MAG: bifunctional adenosylcobinamide kinase/adenosylcobinamide-phosphate guanylyltransferase [Candidatus Melainabacteria bacterium GWF2_37_15]|nr:MAG: bifunctional adenosylcobinamide kinase/adenosylcobinamide-phosphate guanylyltransferase [Candidatus Melainabacteria bacterium GWF2_37_15]